MLYLNMVRSWGLLVFTWLVFGVSLVQARELPEAAGDYADPDMPGVRVRVFVHEPKMQNRIQQILTCDDVDSNSVVGKTEWHLPNNVTYRLNIASTPLNLPVIASEGFKAWASASGNKVNFERGANTSVNRSKMDNQNVIAWGRTNGTALGVTYTRYYTSTGLVADVDTIMNNKFVWGWAYACNPNYYDAQNILTHELGHWMGLDDHYTASYTENTMFGYGEKGEIKKNTLTAGDVAGLSGLY